MNITGILAKAAAKKALYVVCDSIVPGSSLIVKGTFRAFDLFGADRVTEIVGKNGLEKSVDIAASIAETEDSVIDSILNLFMDV